MNRMNSTRQQWNPDIRIRKCKPSVHVQLKMHNYRKPDEGLCIQVSIPSSRAKIDNSSGSMLYVGRYLGHGQSKTAFELDCPGARFHGIVMKIAKGINVEPYIFMEAAENGLTTKILYNCIGLDDDSGDKFHCWITDRTIAFDDFCQYDGALNTDAVSLLIVASSKQRNMGYTYLIVHSKILVLLFQIMLPNTPL